jgi:branched-subunit amino acid aminotransferase/4-amino-4-deoxychorismate lyase
MCQFIETLRIEEERIMNLEAHEKRMNDTIKDFFPQASRVDLRKHIMLQEHTTRTKCHIEYNNANPLCQLSSLPPPSGPQFMADRM